MSNRLFLMKAHALLAAFILPVAVMYIVTGALYTWGEKGSYEKQAHEISVSQALEPELESMLALAKSELDKLAVSYPEGKPKIKKYGNHFLLEWTGSSKDIILEPTNNQLVAKLTVKETTWYRNLVQLHKAKGGEAFKVYAAILSVALLLLLISGFVMAWQTPKLKNSTLVTTLVGAVSFVVFISLS